MVRQAPVGIEADGIFPLGDLLSMCIQRKNGIGVVAPPLEAGGMVAEKIVLPLLPVHKEGIPARVGGIGIVHPDGLSLFHHADLIVERSPVMNGVQLQKLHDAVPVKVVLSLQNGGGLGEGHLRNRHIAVTLRTLSVGEQEPKGVAIRVDLHPAHFIQKYILSKGAAPGKLHLHGLGIFHINDGDGAPGTSGGIEGGIAAVGRPVDLLFQPSLVLPEDIPSFIHQP